MFQSNISGIDPYGPTIQRTPLIPAIFGAAKATGDLYSQAYKNQQDAAKTQLMQQTLPGQIQAANVRNQTDVTNYPLQQAAKTQQAQATIKQIMAQTGLSYAEAANFAAKTNQTNLQTQILGDPMFQTNKMIADWQNAPLDSPQKKILGYALDGQMGGVGGMFPASASSKGSKSTSSTQGGVVPGANGMWTRDQRFGPTRGGGGGTYTDPMNGQQVSTDTNANTTQDQATVAAIQRASPLIDNIMKNQSKFLTFSQQGSLAADRLQNLFGGNKQSPSEYATALASTKLAGESLIKAYGLKVTDESLKLVQDAISPLMGESPIYYKQRLLNTLATIKKNQAEAEGRLKGGIPVGSGTPATMGYFSSRSVSNPGAQQISQKVNSPSQSSMNADTLDAMAQDAIAKGADPVQVLARMKKLRGAVNG